MTNWHRTANTRRLVCNYIFLTKLSPHSTNLHPAIYAPGWIYLFQAELLESQKSWVWFSLRLSPMLSVCLCVCRLSGCMVTEKGCRYLASALSSNPSHLRELDLSYNHPGQSFIKLLSDPNHRLKKLKYVQHWYTSCSLRVNVLTGWCCVCFSYYV